MLHDKIDAYYSKIAADPHHRYRSWEHCYGYFQRAKAAGIAADRDHAALQLGFYLASWGMYRGSSFLLKRTYTVHLEVIECLASAQCAPLWRQEFGADARDIELIPVMLELATAIRTAYSGFGVPSDILVTKVLLGTLGCVPALDEYFRAGFRAEGFSGWSLTRGVLETLLAFSCGHLAELRKEQARIKAEGSVHYPLMKLVDMHFWQIGVDAAREAKGSVEDPDVLP